MRETLRGLLELTRPINAVAAGALTLIGAYVAGVSGSGIATQPVAAAAAVLATVLATAAGNVINDYFDREIDRVNAPNRPIPRGAVSPRGALWFSALLFLGATGAALLLPVLAIAIAAVNLLALIAYTEVFKGLPGVGNLLVAYLGGSTFLFGGVAVGGDIATVATLAALAALSTFTREVIKDVEDVAGDREEGLNTLPIAVGERRALLIGTAALVAAVAASPAPYFLGTFGVVYLAAVVPADLAMLGAAAESYTDPSAAQRHMKYGMFLAAAAFLIGRSVPL
jgi:geranylgeranylglycerol-phosphate geranylgeranyltransferase